MLPVVFLIVGLVNIHEAVFVPKQKYNKTLQVVTSKGTIQGKEDVTDAGVAYFSFSGIPFARPPLGNLRFRSPVPSEKWRGVLDGARIMPGCVESVIRLRNLTIQGEEDCLYLNIFTPQKPSGVKNLPVMVWLYGGAFIEGNSTFYGPQYFMEKNVILITTNYRLGIFGFLSTEDEASPGNYGLKDQLAALKWLKKNIKYFGGDSRKITIFGQSSGACSVMHHVASDKSRGLFSGAIVMSGDALSPWCTQRYQRNVATDIGKALQLETSNTTKFVNALRKVDSNLLKQVQLDIGVVHFLSIYHDGLPFTPTIEPEHKDAFITEPIYNRLKRGDFAKVPIIIGRTSLELHILATALPWLRAFCLLLDTSPSSIVDRFDIPDDHKYEVGEMIKKQYFASNSATSATAEEILHFFTDLSFDIPMERSIQLLSQYTSVYKYIFSYEANSFPEFLDTFFHLRRVKSIKGVNHATEIPLLFKIANINVSDPKDILFRERVTTLWSNFAKYRNPTPQSNNVLQNIIWPPITNSTMVSYLDIGDNLRIKNRYGRENFVQFWNELYSKYILRPYF